MVMNLLELHLNNNEIERIEGLENLVELQCLDMSGNRIRKIEGLGSLGELRSLYLEDNCIERMEGLDGHPVLEVLDLARNRIAVPDGFDTLPSLAKLDLSGNPIRRFWGLHRAPALSALVLHRVDLEKTFLRDVGGVDDWGFANDVKAFKDLCRNREAKKGRGIAAAKALVRGAGSVPVRYLCLALGVALGDIYV